MGEKNIFDFIKSVELFNNLTDAELNEVVDNINTKTFQEGEFLFEENGPRQDIFIIYSGSIELFKRSSLGSEKKLSVFTAGDFLGEGALGTNDTHSTSARATAESTVFFVTKEYFTSHPAVAVKILANVTKVISRRMRQANNRIFNKAAQYESGRTRSEHDLLGDKDIPYESFYGVQTLRALENFNITGVALNFFPEIINGLAYVKLAAAKANYELGILDKEVCDAIVMACEEILQGKYHAHFVVDMIQGGAGTSTNMNANEVIANRALEIMGKEKGEYKYCHPNNHVNLSQSTNDAYPTAVKIALINSLTKFKKILQKLIDSFNAKAEEFAGIIKMGRTQLQDAVPMTLGQAFGAYAANLAEEIDRIDQNAKLFLEINMGATAIGTGINSAPGYDVAVVKHLCEATGLKLVNASNLVEATQDTGSFVMNSSAIKRLAIKLSKICNDLRLMASGPRTGLNEINLPPMQPGSSIMPGKVNPVIPEVVNQIAFKVIGNDLTVTMGAEAGQLELNVMEPVIVQSIFESIEMLKNGMKTLKYRCIDGITANADRCKELVYNSIGLVTALNPVIGYENSSMIAKQALKENRSVYELVLEHKLMSQEELDRVLDPEYMLKPQQMKKQ